VQSVLRVFALAVVVFVAFATLSAQSTDPRIGSWKLDVVKSKYDPGPAPKSAVLKIEPFEQGETNTSETVNADGTKTVIRYSANYDGKDYKLTGSPTADTVSLTRIDSHTTERTDKMGGKTVTVTRRVVAKDGKTFTATSKGTNAQGQTVHNVGVYVKQ
jgi:histidinol dehydrogenase